MLNFNDKKSNKKSLTLATQGKGSLMNFMGMGMGLGMTIKENHRRSKGTLLTVLLFLIFTVGCSDLNKSEQKGTPDKPLNVLFILTDDQAPDTVSAFGNNNINTPIIFILIN